MSQESEHSGFGLHVQNDKQYLMGECERTKLGNAILWYVLSMYHTLFSSADLFQ